MATTRGAIKAKGKRDGKSSAASKKGMLKKSAVPKKDPYKGAKHTLLQKVTSTALLQAPRQSRPNAARKAKVQTVPTAVPRDVPRSPDKAFSDRARPENKSISNEIIASALQELDKPIKKLRVLFLESAEHNTIDRLRSAGVKDDRMYIANPCAEIVRALRTYAPKAHIYEMPVLQCLEKLKGKKRPKKFDAIWLDYCCTFGGNDITNPFVDLTTLFSSDLMADNSFFAVTCCTRGATGKDDCRRYMMAVAAQAYRNSFFAVQGYGQNYGSMVFAPFVLTRCNSLPPVNLDHSLLTRFRTGPAATVVKSQLNADSIVVGDTVQVLLRNHRRGPDQQVYDARQGVIISQGEDCTYTVQFKEAAGAMAEELEMHLPASLFNQMQVLGGWAMARAVPPAEVPSKPEAFVGRYINQWWDQGWGWGICKIQSLNKDGTFETKYALERGERTIRSLPMCTYGKHWTLLQ